MQENKRQGFELPNLALSCLLKEIGPLVEGSFVEKAQDLGKGWLKLRLKTASGPKDLVFSQNAFFFAEYRADAKQQSSGFGAFLKSRIGGKKIIALKQLGSERIVSLKFGDFSLVAELFGKGNLLLLDRNGTILKPFRKEEWSARTLAAGKKYSLPPSRGLNPAAISFSEFKSVMQGSAQDLVRAMLSGINVPPAVAEEACARAGLEKGAAAKSLSESGFKKLHSVLRGFYFFEFAGEKPCSIEHLGKKVLLPFEPKSSAQIVAKFGSLNAGLNEIILKGFLAPAPAGTRRKTELECAISRQREALADCERSAEENRTKAELIYGNYAELMRAVLELRALSATKGAKDAEKPIMYKKDFGAVTLIQTDLKNKKALFELPDA